MREHSAVSKPRAFLAVPMASLRDPIAYKEHRSFIMRVLGELERSNIFEDIYCAARELDSVLQFNDAADALSTDYLALARADVFLMIYAQPVLSSVLVEAGIALGLKKRICIACRTPDDLPFMLRGGLSKRSDFPSIGVVHWGTAEPEPAVVSKMLLCCYTQE